MAKGSQLAIFAVVVAAILVAGVFMMTAKNSSGDGTLTQEDIAENALGSIVMVIDYEGNVGQEGTGYLISYHSEIYIITNAHVILINGTVDQTKETIIVQFSDEFLSGSNVAHAVNVVAYDATKDIAVLKFANNPGRTLTPLSWGDSSKLRYAQDVLVIGNAQAMGLAALKGIISVPLQTISYTPPSNVTGEYSFIRIDMSINPGDSGSPLLDMNGEVVGMPTFRVSGTILSELPINMAFAIPSNDIVEYLGTIASIQ
jgi:S1-C subfamily serine protease